MPIRLAVYVRGLLLVALLGAITFANAVHDRFHFDDEHSLLANPHIRQLSQVPHFFTDPQLFSRNTGSEMYRPLVLLSYALTYHFFDYWAPAYHVVNIVIHLLVAMAVYLLYRRLGLQSAVALFGGVLFAIHPLASEPANYISSRSESLAALFFIGAVLCYADEGRWAVPTALLCYVVALSSKSSAIVLPAVLLACEFMLAEGKARLRWHRLLPFAVLASLYLWGSWRLLSEAVVTAPVRNWSTQLSTQAKALPYYAKLLFFPHSLSVEHQFIAASSWFDLSVILSLALLGAMLYVVWRSRRLRPVVFWLAWIGIVLLPTLIVPLNVLVNERRLYLPMVAAIGAALCCFEGSRWAGRSSFFLVVLILTLASLAQQRNGIWQHEKNLWLDARGKAPLMVRPHVRLGAIFRAEGDITAAKAAYTQALALDADYAPAHNNMGNLYRDMGDSAAAIAAYRRALTLLPHYPDALVNLATLYSDQGRFTEALPLYNKALALAEQRVEIYNNLGTSYLKMAQYRQAERVLRQGLALADERPGLYFNLAGALEGQNRVAEAEATYRHAIAIDSTYARAYYNLALLHEGQGARAQAAADYRGFIRHWRGAELFLHEAQRRLRELATAGEGK